MIFLSGSYFGDLSSNEQTNLTVKLETVTLFENNKKLTWVTTVCVSLIFQSNFVSNFMLF